MSVRSEASLRIERPAADVFAFIEDPANAPRWLEYCIELEQTSPPPRAAGTRLRYVHRQAGPRREMDGVVTAYEPGRRLAMEFRDAMFDVAVELSFTDERTATTVTHSITVTARSLAGRLLVPVIAAGNRRQVVRNLERVKEHVEARPAPRRRT